MGGLCIAALFLAFKGYTYSSPSANAPSVPTTTRYVPAPRPDESLNLVPRIHSLHSRFVSGSQVEVWGQAAAVDGTTVRISVAAAGGEPRLVAVAPTAGGHFRTLARVPAGLRGRRLEVSARTEG